VQSFKLTKSKNCCIAEVLPFINKKQSMKEDNANLTIRSNEQLKFERNFEDEQKRGGSREILTEFKAKEIFMSRDSQSFKSQNAYSVFLARKYHVSPKTIRDIWNGRSWLNATSNFWQGEMHPKKRTGGRPQSSKDTKAYNLNSTRQSMAAAPMSCTPVVAKVEIPFWEQSAFQAVVTPQTQAPISQSRPNCTTSNILLWSPQCESSAWSSRSIYPHPDARSPQMRFNPLCLLAPLIHQASDRLELDAAAPTGSALAPSRLIAFRPASYLPPMRLLSAYKDSSNLHAATAAAAHPPS
jgi:hypothetical protein